jgi:glycosyltransferase involved in cell wall biosynthesis
MKILYHHRTRATDAQRIHIQEMVRAFRELGHEVDVAGVVPLDTAQSDARRDAGDALWKRLVRKVPFAYELVQLAYNLVGIPMLMARTLRGKPDFLYERYALFNFAGVATARLCRIPIVLEVNSPFALEQARDRHIRSHGLARWTESLICRLATRVIVVSTPLARLMQAAGVDAAKIEVMPNGVSLEDFQFRADSSDLRHRLGLVDHLVIGFVGWFRDWHGLDLLLEAFACSGLAAERVKLLLIGDGPAMADLRRIVEEKGLAASVLFTGPLPHAEVPPFLDLIDIAVQPAANEYCCPMKILEYMALGKAIVAPLQDNIRELVSEEEAMFFTPRDVRSFCLALQTLARQVPRAREMGRKARAAVVSRGFLWTANARRAVEMVARPHRSGAPAKPERMDAMLRHPSKR